jgi:hypothetical protein
VVCCREPKYIASLDLLCDQRKVCRRDVMALIDLLNAEYIDMTVPYAAGGLYSTPPDLLKWETALFGGKVLTEASLTKMITPFMSNYAFGLGVEQRGEHKRIAHNGGIEPA